MEEKLVLILACRPKIGCTNTRIKVGGIFKSTTANHVANVILFCCSKFPFQQNRNQKPIPTVNFERLLFGFR